MIKIARIKVWPGRAHPQFNAAGARPAYPSFPYASLAAPTIA